MRSDSAGHRAEGIRERLAALPEVRFALLFGSRVTGRGRPDSDWDVAVYFDDSVDGAHRRALQARLAASLEPEIPVDVVVLNDASALVARRALEGEPLVMRDRRAYVRFFVRTLAQAGDEAYWRRIHAAARRERLAEGRFGRP